MSADDLTARINQAKNNIQKARNLLLEAGEISSKISDTQGVLELIKRGVSKTELEARLIASGWYDVHGGLGSEQRVIWTNPSLEESVRIMTDEQGSSRARVFNGPTGGGRWGSEWNPDAKNGKGGWTSPLVAGEQGLDLDGKPGSPDTTHHSLLPDPPTTQAANIAENIPVRGGALQGVLRGASRALVPIGAAMDAYSLKEAYEADGGFGENFQSTAGGIAGGWGGAAAGAAIGTAIAPGVGTVIGGVIGYIAGSSAGSKIAEGIGSLFD